MENDQDTVLLLLKHVALFLRTTATNPDLSDFHDNVVLEHGAVVTACARLWAQDFLPESCAVWSSVIIHSWFREGHILPRLSFRLKELLNGRKQIAALSTLRVRNALRESEASLAIDTTALLVHLEVLTLLADKDSVNTWKFLLGDDTLAMICEIAMLVLDESTRVGGTELEGAGFRGAELSRMLIARNCVQFLVNATDKASIWKIKWLLSNDLFAIIVNYAILMGRRPYVDLAGDTLFQNVLLNLKPYLSVRSIATKMIMGLRDVEGISKKTTLMHPILQEEWLSFVHVFVASLTLIRLHKRDKNVEMVFCCNVSGVLTSSQVFSNSSCIVSRPASPLD